MQDQSYPWSVRRILDYLADHAIVIRQRGRVFTLSRLSDQIPIAHHESNCAAVLPHVKARRHELIDYLTRVQSAGTVATPAQRRAALFASLREKAAHEYVTEGRVCWFSKYDRSTGWVKPEAATFPPKATSAWVVGVLGGRVTQLTDAYDLPDATPPKGWKPPIERSQDAKRRKREWYERNWGVKDHLKYSDSLPD